MRENTQRPVPAEYGDTVNIHSVFKTIQGEGPHCGERALFIRLNGCNLRCPGCDTEYTEKSQLVTKYWMVKKAQESHWPHGALVVITGGEPMRQSIAEPIRLLLEAGYKVQIETNGVLWPEGLDDLIYRYGGHDKFMIVCSPKTSRIHHRVLACAAAFKYVIREGEVDNADGLPQRALMHTANGGVQRPNERAKVYVQPMDEGDEERNAMNLAATIGSCLRYGYTLQIQVHKHINME